MFGPFGPKGKYIENGIANMLGFQSSEELLKHLRDGVKHFILLQANATSRQPLWKSRWCTGDAQKYQCWLQV